MAPTIHSPKITNIPTIINTFSIFSTTLDPTCTNKQNPALPHQSTIYPNIHNPIPPTDVADSLTTYPISQNDPFPTRPTVNEPNKVYSINSQLVLNLVNTGPTINNSPPQIYRDIIPSSTFTNIPSTSQSTKHSPSHSLLNKNAEETINIPTNNLL